MIILRMRASFGTLNGELTLHEGMNLLCLPNESGKSTWSAFLLAMLYGVDTSEKASAANHYLPFKERYKPWDGRPMEGTIDLLRRGRKITIERKTVNRIPMGAFRAYETDSGTEISELNAANCGLMLCGVERSVFERTAFIRQLGVTVSEDAKLEKRLGALVTTGEEGITASELQKALHERQVKLSRPTTGRISRLGQQIDRTKRTLDDLRAMQTETMRLRAKIDEAQAQADERAALLRRIESAKNAKKYLAMEELLQKSMAQEERCRVLRQQLADLPDEASVRSLQRELEQSDSRLRTAQMEAAFVSEQPTKPTFDGMELPEAILQAQKDEKSYRNLTEKQASKPISPLIFAVITALGAAGCFLSLPLGLALSGVGLAALFLSLWRRKRATAEAEARRKEAEEILSRYDIDEIGKLPSLTDAWRKQLEGYEAATSQAEAERRKRTAELEAAQTAVDEILSAVRAFCPDCPDVAKAREALAALSELHGRNLSEQRNLELQRSQLASMRQLIGTTQPDEYDPEALKLDEAKLSYEYSAALRQLDDLRSELDKNIGKLDVLGDPIALNSELEQLSSELSDAGERAEILRIAEDALLRADAALRSRFSPQITAEAGAILAEMTGGKYPKLLLQPNMSLSVWEKDGTVTRPSAAMSCGTADQMYLALRLAMCRRMLEDDVPLVLDDALINFDDDRTAAALKLLEREAQERQIILFTCKEIS